MFDMILRFDKPIIVIGWSLVIALGFTYVVIQVDKSTVGFELAEMQRQKKELQSQNAVLKQEILEASALTTIEKKASEQGFEPAENGDFIYFK